MRPDHALRRTAPGVTPCAAYRNNQFHPSSSTTTAMSRYFIAPPRRPHGRNPSTFRTESIRVTIPWGGCSTYPRTDAQFTSLSPSARPVMLHHYSQRFVPFFAPLATLQPTIPIISYRTLFPISRDTHRSHVAAYGRQLPLIQRVDAGNL